MRFVSETQEGCFSHGATACGFSKKTAGFSMEIPNSLIAVPEWVLLVAQAIYKFTGALTVLRYTHTGSSRDGHIAANSVIV